MEIAIRLVLDSVIVIDHLNGHKSATKFILDHAKEIALSAITRAEVLTGSPATEKWAIKKLLNFFPTFSITAEIADSAADLREKMGLKLPDALQAAVAIVNQCQLVIRNTKDFPPSKFRFVHLPYRL